MGILNARIVLRNDSTENWVANETQVLLKGEVGLEYLESGKVKMKIGDGETAWSDLEYFGGETLTSDGKSILVEEDVIKLLNFDTAETGAQPRKNADGELEWFVPSAESVEGLTTIVNELQTRVETLEDASAKDGEANVIETVKINGEALEVADKAVNIPVAGATFGVVKSATGDNKVTVDENGEMSVNSININTIVQAEGDELILSGGTSN